MLILYFQKTYYPDPTMPIESGMVRTPGVGGAGSAATRAKKDMLPSKSLTDNAIG